jgi:lipoprotein-releasing system permease protein
MDKLQQFFLSRYLKSPKRNLLRFSFVFMTLGIILSVGILSAGLNLFEGYENSLKKVLLGSFPHLTIQKNDAEYINPDELHTLMAKLNVHPEIQLTTPVISYSVMAVGSSKVRGATLNGYDFSGRYPFPQAKYINNGNQTLKNGEIIIGKYLAKELGKQPGDTLQVVYPQLDRISALGIIPSQHNYLITGIYNSGFYESDRSMLICTLEDSETLLNINPGFAKLELRVHPEFVEQSSDMATTIQNELGPDYSVYPWTFFGAGLLKLVAMEKWLIFIVFSFLVLIAGINVISAVATIIADKKNEIAVLKTLGASSSSIKKVLSYQVGLVGLAAIVLGQILGALLSVLVEHQGFYQLKGDVYFIDKLSASILPVNLLIVFSVSAALVFTCILYPLKQIDKLQIIELLRNP